MIPKPKYKESKVPEKKHRYVLASSTHFAWTEILPNYFQHTQSHTRKQIEPRKSESTKFDRVATTAALLEEQQRRSRHQPRLEPSHAPLHIDDAKDAMVIILRVCTPEYV